MAIAKRLLLNARVDRIEIASARVSVGEQETVKRICAWAKTNKLLDKIEVLGFVDNAASVEWLKTAGCKRLNLLCKGSERHCREQLKKKSEEHFANIETTVCFAQKNNIAVSAYLEDWSNGIQQSQDYVFALTKKLLSLGVERIYLADTLGILNPANTQELVKKMIAKFPKAVFEFHAHNDYGLSTANCLAAVSAGAGGLHVTVNGLGERAGNTALDEIVAGLKDQLQLQTNVAEKELFELSKIVETFSGKRVAFNKPIAGENVFIQTAGIHADGDKKNGLYCSALSPERFGRQRQYALGKLSGKASVEMNLKNLGIELSKEQLAAVLARVVELGDKKESVSVADLPFIVEDVLQSATKEKIKIVGFNVLVENGKQPLARVKVKINGSVLQESAFGDGGYDAFMKALTKAVKGTLELAELVDYNVRIPPGGKTDALVETTIAWRKNGLQFSTVGIDSDQLVAAVKATEKMLNFVAR